MADHRRWREDDDNSRREDDRDRAKRYRSEDRYRSGDQHRAQERSRGEEYWARDPNYWSGPGSRGEPGRWEDEDRWLRGRQGGYGGGWAGYGRGGYMSEPGRGHGGERERYGREDYRSGNRGEDRGMWDRASDEVASWFGDEDAERRRRVDAAREGRHRGRGPKGYARSDDRIREDVSDRLSDDAMVDASDVEVSVSDREVTLSGTVDSREARRRAEDLAEQVSGVSYVQNNLRVQAQGAGASAGSTPGGSTTR